jgi:hypothetical protein
VLLAQIDQLFALLAKLSVRVPPLYRELYKWSEAPTPDDHCWHEFVGFRALAEAEAGAHEISVREFVERFAAVDYWNEGL